jgi:hypothetical protein
MVEPYLSVYRDALKTTLSELVTVSVDPVAGVNERDAIYQTAPIQREQEPHRHSKQRAVQ